MVSVYAASLLAQKRSPLILSCMIAEPSILLKDTIVLEDNRRKKAKKDLWLNGKGLHKNIDCRLERRRSIQGGRQ